MLTRFSILLVLLFFFTNSFSQNKFVKKNSVSLELAGTGLFYSINYDRLILIDKNIRFSVTTGFWYIPQINRVSDFQTFMGGTIGFNTIFGKQTHFGELGFGFSYINMRQENGTMYHTTYLPIRIGYRYQKDDGGLFLRASFMPIFENYQHFDVKVLAVITPYFALAIGYSF